MRSFRWLAVIVLSLGVAAVAAAQEKAKEKPKGLAQTSAYFPLKVGSVWTYRAGEASFTRKVTGIEEVNKVPCAVVETVVHNRVANTEHIGVTKDGVQRLKWAVGKKKDAKEAKPPIRFLPLELKEGAEWSVEGKFGDDKIEGKFVLSGVKTREKVKIGDREYETVVVTGKDLKVNGEAAGLKYYFAENIGMVKQELEVGGNKFIFELDKYEPPTEEKKK